MEGMPWFPIPWTTMLHVVRVATACRTACAWWRVAGGGVSRCLTGGANEAAPPRTASTPSTWPSLEAAGTAAHLVGKLQTHLRIRRAAPVQTAAVPVIAGAVQPCPAAPSAYDVTLHAPTGSGKTLAYLIPLLGSIPPASYAHAKLRVVVVTPTRELAHQVAHVAAELAAEGKKRQRQAVPAGGVNMVGEGGLPASSPRLLRIQKVVGEVSQQALHALAHHHPHVLIGTPASLAQVIPHHVNCGEVTAVVVDEADECVRNYHAGALTTLMKTFTRAKRRPALIAVSATGSDGLTSWLRAWARVPSMRTVDLTGGRLTMPPHLTHLIYRVPPAAAAGGMAPYHAFTRMLAAVKPGGGVLSFHNSAASLESMEAYLKAKHVRVVVMGSAYSVAERNKSTAALGRGAAQVMLSTEMGARGLHLPTLTHVVNFDLPHSAREYVHRAGRVGRLHPDASSGGGAAATTPPAAVAAGTVINFARTDEEVARCQALLRGLRATPRMLVIDHGASMVTDCASQG